MSGIDSTAAAIEASHVERDRLRAEVALLGAEIKRLQGLVLRPLTEAEITAALHEGHAERRAAEGDNAWTSLIADRDRHRAEVDRLTKFAAAEFEKGYDQAVLEIRDHFARKGESAVVIVIDKIWRAS